MYISKLKGLGARVSVHPAGNLDCVLSSQVGNISVRRKINISFIQVARLVTAHYHPVIQDEDIVITADVDGFIMSPRILDPLQKAWNNGKEVPRWGIAEIQKMSLSTTGRCK